VPFAHDSDETIPEQAVRPHLGARRLPHDAGLQIDGAVAKRCAFLVRFQDEAQPHAGSLCRDAGDELRSEVLDEALARAKRERPDELREVDLLDGPENRARVVYGARAAGSSPTG